MSLIDRKIYPPFLSLVNVHHDKAAGHIPVFIILLSASADIDQWEFLKALRNKLGLVGAKLKFPQLSVPGSVSKHRLFKLP